MGQQRVCGQFRARLVCFSRRARIVRHALAEGRAKWQRAWHPISLDDGVALDPQSPWTQPRRWSPRSLPPSIPSTHFYKPPSHRLWRFNRCRDHRPCRKSCGEPPAVTRGLSDRSRQQLVDLGRALQIDPLKVQSTVSALRRNPIFAGGCPGTWHTFAQERCNRYEAFCGGKAIHSDAGKTVSSRVPRRIRPAWTWRPNGPSTRRVKYLTF